MSQDQGENFGQSNNFPYIMIRSVQRHRECGREALDIIQLLTFKVGQYHEYGGQYDPVFTSMKVNNCILFYAYDCFCPNRIQL